MNKQIRADEVTPGVTYTDRSGTNWIVRDAKPGRDAGIVALRLAAGRTDPGSWEPYRADEIVTVYEPRVILR